MNDLLNGKITIKREADLFTEETTDKIEIVMSKEACAVYNAGLKLWKYYHECDGNTTNASLYDIRKFFQGETDGKMNTLSNDEKYNELISQLREEMKNLAKKIEPKVYEHGFLKR